MLFSIITVVYNGSITIEKTIQSVVSQDFDDFEFIIVDGNSLDDTLAVIEKYSSHVDVLISEPDDGIYDAMNKGISYARGEYVVFMNAGDTFYNSRVLSFVSRFTNQEYDVLYGDTIAQNIIHQYEKTYKVKPLKDLWKSLGYCGLCHQSIFVNRMVLSKHVFNKKYNICADFEQILSIRLLNHSFFYLDETISIVAEDGVSANEVIRSKLESFSIARDKKKQLDVNVFEIMSFYCINIISKFLKLKLKQILGSKLYSRGLMINSRFKSLKD